MSFSVAGKSVIVTGAANGVGLAIARRFVKEGANVVLADMDDNGLKAEVDKGTEEETSARTFAGDLRQHLAQANLLSATIDAFERVDVLINAARQVLPSDPMDPKADEVEEMLSQNLMGSLRLSQLVAKRMIKQAEGDEDEGPVGAIVNLSSIAARCTQPGLMGYSISTAAADQMTRALAVELAPHRIRVNAVAFGSVLSNSLNTRIKANPDYRDNIIKGTPMGRIAKPGAVAEAAQFLASDAASFITGQVVTVDGGRSLLDPVNAPAH
ncbi:SDR family oxidoreductase [Alphaproteobacteria bacterium KMM 3653]|uniref:SDR family oxidoreductase n=1 Tax=Harenicola maris TaxID=2841044 RepID=A0AAP2G9B1_9RHOB|nr:SDR family oxidoreductase [Harenicola maris]